MPALKSSKGGCFCVLWSDALRKARSQLVNWIIFASLQMTHNSTASISASAAASLPDVTFAPFSSRQQSLSQAHKKVWASYSFQRLNFSYLTSLWELRVIPLDQTTSSLQVASLRQKVSAPIPSHRCSVSHWDIPSLRAQISTHW